MSKRLFEEVNGSVSTQPARYPSSGRVIAAARMEVAVADAMSTSSSKPSSAVNNRRISTSSEGMGQYAQQINSFKGKAFESAASFQRLGSNAPLHTNTISHSAVPQTRPESSGGVTAKVQSLLDGFSRQVDAKIDSKVQPLVAAQGAVKGEVAALRQEVRQVDQNVAMQLSEQDERNAQLNEESSQRIMQGVRAGQLHEI